MRMPVLESVISGEWYQNFNYNPEWDFVQWGIYYWLNQEGMKEHSEKGSTEKLNKPGTYKPFDEPFEKTKQELMQKFLFLHQFFRLKYIQYYCTLRGDAHRISEKYQNE